MAKTGKIIRNGVNYSGGGSANIEYLTQAEYDALPESKLTNGVEYRIIDNNPATPSAKNMAYDGTASGLEANNVQDAIDAVSSNLDNTNILKNGIGIEIGSKVSLTYQGNLGVIRFDDATITDGKDDLFSLPSGISSITGIGLLTNKKSSTPYVVIIHSTKLNIRDYSFNTVSSLDTVRGSIPVTVSYTE